MSTMDRKIEAIARAQYGAFNLDQARRAGATNDMIRRRIESGVWRREVRGVYTHNAFLRSWEQRLMVGILSKRGAVAAGRAAAALHRLLGFRQGRIEIAVDPTVNHQSKIALVRRSATIESTTVDGFPTTTLRQTLFDLAGTVPFPKLHRAVEAAVVENRLSIDQLGDRLLELSSLTPAGIDDIRRIVDEMGRAAYEPARSDLERILYGALEELGVPVVRQASFPWRDPKPMQVDGAVPDWGLITEADGRRWHTRIADIERDVRRDHAATLHGFHVLRFTQHMLTRDLDYVRATLNEFRSSRRAA
jgi:very-short-patch-repair endonuclease